MTNSLKESIGKMKDTMKILEDRIDKKIEDQKVEIDLDIQEVEERLVRKTMEETDWLKGYMDTSITQRSEVIKAGITEMARQVDRRFQEMEKIEARYNEKYEALEDKISEICVNSSKIISMEERINDPNEKIEIGRAHV